MNPSVTLPNDLAPGEVDDDDYGVWKSHSGESLLGGASGSPVPEPAGIALAAIVSMSVATLRRKR